jgi:signal transduction histidine kinase
VLVTLWNYPSTELVIFHCVWIGLAVLALRKPSPRLHSWALVSVVTGLAVIIEVHDVRSGTEGVESLVEIMLDLVAFVALVYLARSHGRALALEHEAAVTEHHRNERQRAFFANASHALRTPITVAHGHAELVLHDTTSVSARADLEVIIDELDRLARATDRILRLSVAGKLDPQRHLPVEVDELVRSTIERWAPAAPRAWAAEPHCPGLLIMADPEALTEALDALVDNALSATWPGGAITIRSQIDGDNVVLSVSDDGLGVEGIDPSHLFDPFQQGPRRSRHGSGGTGLGLAIVRAIANAHGGEAAMHSSPGLGATVTITLPHNGSSASHPTASSPQPIVAL